MVVSINYTPPGLRSRLGRKPSSRQENAIAKFTIRVVEVIELGTNSK